MASETRPTRTAKDGGGWTVRAIGILILAGWITYGPGGMITKGVLDAPDALASVGANQTTFALGAVLMLLNSATVVGIGVLWVPILRPHSERVALSYLSVRVLEAMLCALGVISLLSLIGLSDSYLSAGAAAGGQFETLGVVAVEVNDLAYHVGMAALGAGSLAFCSLLYRTRLVPAALAAWGLVGYAVFLAGMLLELVGVGFGVPLSLPGGLFELVFAAWLLVKGGRAGAAIRQATDADPSSAASITRRPDSRTGEANSTVSRVWRASHRPRPSS